MTVCVFAASSSRVNNEHGMVAARLGSLLDFIDHMIDNNFLRAEHKGIWEVVTTPEEVLTALGNKERGNEEWRKIAKI